MAISSARMKELIAKYDVIKGKVEDIDRKYSLDYREPLLDMPESLGLTKLQYVPKTEEQLRAAAEERIAASYIAKQGRLNSSYAANLQKLATRYSELDADLRGKLNKLLKDYNETCDKLYVRLVDNGLRFSSILTRANNQARDDYNKAVTEQNAAAQGERSLIDADKQSQDSIYSDACASLEEEKQSKLNETYAKLVQDESKTKQNIDKYNAKLDEKEAKYQASRARAYEYARQAEYDRSFTAAKLYAQLGATGYAEKMQWEKYRVFQQGFVSLLKEEALALVNMDTFARGHLQDYYTTLIDWINRNLQ